VPTPRYDLSLVLNYYAPYVSGLTESAREIAEGLAGRGWRVAVVASRHDRSLARREALAGVDVIRCPVVGAVSRAAISPTFPAVAGRVVRQSAVANLHLPMLGAGTVARLAGSTPLVSTYHIDLYLPPGPMRSVLTPVADASCRSALRRSAAVAVNSADQAEHSRLRPILQAGDLRLIPAPCRDRRGGSPSFRETRGLHVGFAGRIVEDKGLDYLVDGFRRLPDPDARLLIAGDHDTVAGGSVLAGLRELIGEDDRVRILGLLDAAGMADLYASIDVFALPSVSESFGIVQAEAMMVGVPSVTTDIPGGRVPVVDTGFGALVPPRDPRAIADAVLALADLTPEQRAAGAADALKRYSLAGCLDAYEDLFRSVARHRRLPFPTPATKQTSGARAERGVRQ
jgi:glycosyltransferase involved in cell wall biosynthesis